MALRDFSYDELIDLLIDQAGRLRHEGVLERFMIYERMQETLQELHVRITYPDLYNEVVRGRLYTEKPLRGPLPKTEED